MDDRRLHRDRVLGDPPVGVRPVEPHVFDVTLIPGTTSLWGAGDVLGKTNSSAAIFACGWVG